MAPHLALILGIVLLWSTNYYEHTPAGQRSAGEMAIFAISLVGYAIFSYFLAAVSWFVDRAEKKEKEEQERLREQLHMQSVDLRWRPPRDSPWKQPEPRPGQRRKPRRY